MASSDVDQKYLGRIADVLFEVNPLVSKSLYQILGLSVLLARKLYRARRLRKLDTSRDTKSLQLYHHIIWLSREGFSILEVIVLPYTLDGSLGPECQVLTAKLRASFFHIFCLFHNYPPVSTLSIPIPPGTVPAPVTSPKAEAGQRRDRRSGGSADLHSSKRNSRGKQSMFRDPIASIASEASFLTNPFEGLEPGMTPPPDFSTRFMLQPLTVPHPSAFLLPPMDFIPLARDYFTTAMAIAAEALPGAHPLRLSVGIEYAAFLWDCVHDHEASRQLARRAIRELRDAEEEGVTDEMFEDAAEMVGMLGRTMRRRSWESTPPKGIAKVTDPQTPTVAKAAANNALLFSSPATPAPSGPLPAPPVVSPESKRSQPTTPRRVRISHESQGSISGIPQIDGANISPTANTSASRRTSKSTTTTQRSHQRDRSSGTGKSIISMQGSGRGQPAPILEHDEDGMIEETAPVPPPKDRVTDKATITGTTSRKEPSPADNSDSRSRSGSRARDRLEAERDKERAKAARQHEERHRQSNDTSRTTPRTSRPSSAGKSSSRPSGRSRNGSTAETTRPSSDSQYVPFPTVIPAKSRDQAKATAIEQSTNRVSGRTATRPSQPKVTAPLFGNDDDLDSYPFTASAPGDMAYDLSDRDYETDGAVSGVFGGPVGGYATANGPTTAMAGPGQRRTKKGVVKGKDQQ